MRKNNLKSITEKPKFNVKLKSLKNLKNWYKNSSLREKK